VRHRLKMEKKPGVCDGGEGIQAERPVRQVGGFWGGGLFLWQKGRTLRGRDRWGGL